MKQTSENTKHSLTNARGGKGIEGWIQPECSCGWVGSRHYAHNDYQHSNCREERQRHVRWDKVSLREVLEVA